MYPRRRLRVLLYPRYPRHKRKSRLVSRKTVPTSPSPSNQYPASQPTTDVWRLNIGGKFLTNYLKEVISYRHYNMMEETYLINKVKESCCFMSQDFSADLERIKARKGGEIRYVLPDYSHSKDGYVLKDGETVGDDQQLLVLGNERFAIPELLFTPSDVGQTPPHLPHTPRS